MLFVSLLQWWYTAGWLQIIHRLGERLEGVMGFFSITMLLKSLFAPFRETFADKVSGGPVDAQLRAWVDRQISRGIGAMIRSAVIIFGLLIAVGFAAVALLILVAWPLLPILPIIMLIIGISV